VKEQRIKLEVALSRNFPNIMKKIISLVLIVVVVVASSCNRKGYCPAYDSTVKVEKKA